MNEVVLLSLLWSLSYVSRSTLTLNFDNCTIKALKVGCEGLFKDAGRNVVKRVDFLIDKVLRHFPFSECEKQEKSRKLFIFKRFQLHDSLRMNMIKNSTITSNLFLNFSFYVCRASRALLSLSHHLSDDWSSSLSHHHHWSHHHSEAARRCRRLLQR